MFLKFKIVDSDRYEPNLPVYNHNLKFPYQSKVRMKKTALKISEMATLPKSS